MKISKKNRNHVLNVAPPHGYCTEKHRILRKKQHWCPTRAPRDVLVISVDSKGIAIYVSVRGGVSILFFILFRLVHSLPRYFSFRDAIEFAQGSACAVAGTAAPFFLHARGSDCTIDSSHSFSRPCCCDNCWSTCAAYNDPASRKRLYFRHTAQRRKKPHYRGRWTPCLVVLISS